MRRMKCRGRHDIYLYAHYRRGTCGACAARAGATTTPKLKGQANALNSHAVYGAGILALGGSSVVGSKEYIYIFRIQVGDS